MKLIESFLRLTDWLNAKFAWVVAFLVVPMLVIMVLEIVMRYFFNAPSLWAYEVSKFLYGGYIVLGGAYTLMAGGHVNVDIIWTKLSPRGKAIADIITCGFAFLFLGVLFWFSLERAILSTQLNETTMTQWQPIVWPVRWTIPIACLLFLMQAVAKLIRDIGTLVTGDDDFFPVHAKVP
ncbi:MAG: TRAP transporter small permease subunit [Pseudomonadota bacterium]